MNNIEEKWIDYLSNCWNSEFKHSYINNKSKKIWNCNSLKNAYENYTWNQKDFKSTEELLETYSKDLLEAISDNNNDKAYELCINVLKWGGVSGNVKGGRPRPTVAWLSSQLKSTTLSASILKGLDALRNGSFKLFDGKTFPMDSSATKIFSVADEYKKIIIYDGRVGAALGLLARNFLIKNDINYLPHELKFMWGGSKSTNLNRDPSKDIYKFQQLWSENDKNQKHAKMVIQTSDLISQLSIKTGSTSRQWEAALFMVGYDLGINE